MSILAWIEDQRNFKLLKAPNLPSDKSKNRVLWTRCEDCGSILFIKHLKQNNSICPSCGSLFQMTSQERIDFLTDSGTWRPLDETVSPCDPLEFNNQKNYTQKLKEAQESTHLQDAVQTGTAMLDSIPIALGVMDFNFIGGSMGSVVGEKITRLIEYATQEGLTLLLVSASGGARMHEGVLSLMQMAKISAALQIYQSSANLVYISVITSPTTGGVTASFAMLGDIIISEPHAVIAFAGRRVIKDTLQEVLPDEFQTAEYLLDHGFLDFIVSRSFIRQALSEIMIFHNQAPFRRSGVIPYGLLQNLSFVTEEKLRRNLSLFKQDNLNPSLQDKSSSKQAKQVHESATQTNLKLGTKTLESIRFAQPVLYQPTKLLETQAEKESLVAQKFFAPSALDKKGLILDSSKLKSSEEFKDLKKQLDFKQEFALHKKSLSYKETLLSFCFVFNFFLSGQSTKFFSSSKQLSAKHHMGNVDLKPNLTAQADFKDLVEESILVARTQIVEWQTFYVTQDQRVASCANLNTFTRPNNQKDGFHFVRPTIIKPEQDKTTNQKADYVDETEKSHLFSSSSQSNKKKQEDTINSLPKDTVNSLFACLIFKNIPNVVS